MVENNYDILRIVEGSTEKEIRDAFRRLALQFHSDRGGENEQFIKIKIDPGDPIEENVYRLSSEKKREYNIGSLPVSLKGALDSLASDSKFLEEIFTRDFLDKYSELKYKEYTAFAQTPTAWEVSMYADA